MPNFPVHEKLEVKDGHTIFKNDDWWKAVVLYDGFNGTEIAVYLWNEQDGNWGRKQKFVVNDEDEWEETKEVIDSFLPEVA